jgi:hypothetical protein
MAMVFWFILSWVSIRNLHIPYNSGECSIRLLATSTFHKSIYWMSSIDTINLRSDVYPNA